MRDFPLDLVFFVLFGIAMLVQFLLRRWRQRGSPLPDDEPAAEDDFEPEQAQPPRVAAALPEVPRRVAEPRVARHRAAPPPRNPHRFARTTLMGNRRALQDAIVVATILGPCRAYRPHDID
jgi:hypothetical protein